MDKLGTMVKPAASKAYWHPRRALQALGAVLTLLAVWALLFLPTYMTTSTDQFGNEVVGSATAWDVNGAWLLVVLAFPLLLAVLPLLVRGRAWYGVSLTCTVLLGVFVVLGSLSLGFFFLPGFIAMLIAVLLRPRRST